MSFFFTVAAWINAGLMKDVVTAIINSVNIHSDSPDVAVGACKALSEVASHGKYIHALTNVI